MARILWPCERDCQAQHVLTEQNVRDSPGASILSSLVLLLLAMKTLWAADATMEHKHCRTRPHLQRRAWRAEESRRTSLMSTTLPTQSVDFYNGHR